MSHKNQLLSGGQCYYLVLLAHVQILSKMEVSLLHQLRHEYNKTGRALNRSELNPQIMLSQHVTVVMDAIQLKVRTSTSPSPTLDTAKISTY